MKIKSYLLKIFGIAFASILVLYDPLLANDVNSHKIDRNVSAQQENSSETFNNKKESVGIPQKIKSFFGGILDDVRKFGEDNHINNSEK